MIEKKGTKFKKANKQCQIKTGIKFSNSVNFMKLLKEKSGDSDI